MKIASFFLILVFHRTLADNNFYTVSDGGETKICLKCPPGAYVLKNCIQSETKSTECSPCPSGRYTDTWNGWHACKECRPYCYEVNMITTTECQPDQNIVCGCNDGYWQHNAGTASAKCLPLSECAVGSGVDKQATNRSDATCIKCIEGKNFSSIVSSYETCQPCRDCEKEGYNETKKCTVISNAVCFIPTTSSITTTEVKTKGDDPNVGEEGHSNVKIIVSTVSILVIVILIIGYCGYNSWHKKKNQKKNQKKYSVSFRTDSDQVCVEGLIGRPWLPITSNLSLRQGVTLENDVFIWLSKRLGGHNYIGIIKSLPGSSVEGRISNADIADAKYQHKECLSDAIAELLLIWRNKNSDKKNEVELFKDIITLLHDNESDEMKDLAQKMRDKFAR